MASYQLPSGISLTEAGSGSFMLPDGSTVLEAASASSDVSGSAALGDVSAAGSMSGPSDLGGSATLDDVTAAGGISSQADGSLGGGATLDDVAASGTVAGSGGVGSVTTTTFKVNNGIAVAAGTNIPWAKAIRCSDGVVVLEVTNQLLNGSSQLVLASGFLVPGVKYQIVASDLTGTYFGMEPVTAV